MSLLFYLFIYYYAEAGHRYTYTKEKQEPNEKSAHKDANTARPPQTHKQDRLQYTVPLASTQCNNQKSKSSIRPYQQNTSIYSPL